MKCSSVVQHLLIGSFIQGNAENHLLCIPLQGKLLRGAYVGNRKNPTTCEYSFMSPLCRRIANWEYLNIALGRSILILHSGPLIRSFVTYAPSSCVLLHGEGWIPSLETSAIRAVSANWTILILCSMPPTSLSLLCNWCLFRRHNNNENILLTQLVSDHFFRCRPLQWVIMEAGIPDASWGYSFS